MSEDTSVPASDNADVTLAPEGDTSADKTSHMIPKSRLDDEIRKRREVEDSLAHMAETVIGTVPEAYRDLIPEGSPAQRAAWVHKAHETGLFQKPVVPTTDTSKPKGSTPATDYSSMTATQRLAAAFNTRK
jgi:hypothetical protein